MPGRCTASDRDSRMACSDSKVDGTLRVNVKGRIQVKQEGEEFPASPAGSQPVAKVD
ncbi:hypothetical protein J6590_003327 [Homalodisca vitripennis]|nr:hypothetical protein J6590_003327 [Homalodisca vitripennis]